MTNDPILSLLGLANKAGRLEIGEEPVGAVCRARKARLLLLACDTTPNTRRRCAHFGEAGNVLWLELPYSKEQLGFQLGRSSCAMLALTDAGFAASIVEKLAIRDPERYGPAAQQLRSKADRMLQRQREKRQHEKNIQQGKRKPWVSPPPKECAKADRPAQHSPPQSHQTSHKPRPPKSGGAFSHKKGGFDRPPKPGPGGRRLTGKFRP
jgi:ribosomal protein L7Ae-like RNA K-turn-binding protein